MTGIHRPGRDRPASLVAVALVGELLADLGVHASKRGPGREPGGWAGRLRLCCAVLAEALDRHPGLAEALLTGPTPAPMLVAHQVLTEQIADAGLSVDDAGAVVTTALRATVGAAVAATAGLAVTLPDVGLPRVVLDALTTHAAWAAARPVHPAGQTTAGLNALADDLAELAAALRAGNAEIGPYTVRRRGRHARLSVEATWFSEPT